MLVYFGLARRVVHYFSLKLIIESEQRSGAVVSVLGS